MDSGKGLRAIFDILEVCSRGGRMGNAAEVQIPGTQECWISGIKRTRLTGIVFLIVGTVGVVIHYMT